MGVVALEEVDAMFDGRIGGYVGVESRWQS